MDEIVRAKFVCTASHAESGSVALIPVVASTDNEENTKFFAATPGGAISMNGLSAGVAAKFVSGQSYYIDFTPA
jgi:hypothetical protein